MGSEMCIRDRFLPNVWTPRPSFRNLPITLSILGCERATVRHLTTTSKRNAARSWPQICVRGDMTLEDWVTLSVIWWSGDKRRAIADWLSEHAHRRTYVTSEMTLQGLLADIDRVQSATLDVSAARARAVVALGAARSRGISVVSWAAEDYPTSLSMICL